ncbi:MAG: hypothetical protein ACJAYE_000610 [Candidatus Azotimanducaceae bacterium]
MTGAWTSFGGNFDSPTFPGLTFNSSTGTLFGSESNLQELFSIDTNTGARTSIAEIAELVVLRSSWDVMLNMNFSATDQTKYPAINYVTGRFVGIVSR